MCPVACVAPPHNNNDKVYCCCFKGMAEAVLLLWCPVCVAFVGGCLGLQGAAHIRGSHLGKPKAEPGLQMAEGGESLLRCAPRGCWTQPVSRFRFFWMSSHRLREGGCLLFCGFSAICVGMHCLHSLFGSSTFSSPVNVRGRTDAPSGLPWISRLVTKPLVQTRLAWLCLLLFTLTAQPRF